MRTNIHELRYLAGMEPLEESAQDEKIDEEAQALAEATVTINQKIKDAEKAFLGNVAVVAKKYMRQMHRGLKMDVTIMPAMGGGGSIGGVRLTGENWQLDAVISRKGDRWEFWKSGTMAVGISKPVEIKDTAKVNDVHPESVAMGLNALYSALVEKNEDARHAAG